MAQVSSAGASPLPPPPSTGGAPGQQSYGQQPYDPSQGNGTHMPPPLNIPQNNNPIPTDMSRVNPGLMSPTGGAGSVTRAAPEPNKRALYVGGLDLRVTEDVLKKIFETTGHVQSVKIIPDKNDFVYDNATNSWKRKNPSVVYPSYTAASTTSQYPHHQYPTYSGSSNTYPYSTYNYPNTFTNTANPAPYNPHFTSQSAAQTISHNTAQASSAAQQTGYTSEANLSDQAKGFNYGFVEYDDPAAAERAMASLNGRRVHNTEIRVNWAYQSNTISKEDTSGHFHIFVGDLSNEVNDEVLLQAFSTFGTVSEARVMWDMKTGRSRGYGFVAFRDRGDAEKALSAMDGEWLGSRAIRCNWANQKGQPSFTQQQAMAAMGMTPTTPYGGHHQFPAQGAQSYEMVVQQTPQWQTTCYVGNLTAYTNQNDLVPLFQNFGYVVETRFQSDRGFAFIKMDTHENAANAICQLNGYNVNGRPLKCSWGKDRPPTQQFDYSPASGGPASAYAPPTPQGYGFPQYGGQPTMSPAGPSPGGHFNQAPPGYPPQQGYGNMGPSPGAYGRGQAPGGYMAQSHQGGSGGYQGGYQG